MTCRSYLYPNTILNNEKLNNEKLNNEEMCYIPHCPPELPFKCGSGLCVTDKKFCSNSDSLLSTVCQDQAVKSGTNSTLACGDGTCVTRAEHCPPLYDCALNPVEKIRCKTDGSCRASESECPTEASSTCPSSLPHLCASGLCSRDKNSCLRSDNGCPFSAPYRCEYTGICLADASHCFSPFAMISHLALLEDDERPNICKRFGKVLCLPADNESLIFCADSYDEYRSASSGCPVTKLILCADKLTCASSVASCPDSQRMLLAITEELGPAPTVDKVELNHNMCPASEPFRCSHFDINDCKPLPYTSSEELLDQACGTKLQSLQDAYLLN